MTGRRVWGSPYETQRNVRTIIYTRVRNRPLDGVGRNTLDRDETAKERSDVMARPMVEPFRRRHGLFKALLLAAMVLLPDVASP